MIPILSSILVSHNSSEGHSSRAIRGFLISLIYVLAMAVTYTIVGVLSGGSSMLHPFEAFTSASSPHERMVENPPSQGYSLKKLQEEIAKSDKPVVVEFSKKSCTACRELEFVTFANVGVKKRLQDFTFITVDISEQTEEDKAMLKAYHLFGTPNMIFFDRDGKFLASKSLTGFIDAKHFLSHLKTL